MKKILLMMAIVLMLTGCYNYREINDLAIASGISISKTNEDEFKLTVEVVNPKKQQDTSSSYEPDFIIYTKTGTSIQEAFRKMINEAPNKIYGAQIQILILDESVIKEDLQNVIDFFSRDPEIRSEFYVLVGNGEDILEVITPLENINSKNILESLRANNSYLGVSNLVTYHDLMSNYLNSKIELALPSVSLVGNENNGKTIKNTETTNSYAKPTLSNIAVLKDNKFLGYLTEKQSIAYNFVMDNINTTLIRTNYEDNHFVINELIDVSSETKAEVKENKIKINISGKASISEVNYEVDLTNPKEIKRLEKDMNKTIEKMVNEAVNDIIYTYNSDIFGFQELFYKTDVKYYNKIKKDWEKKIFPNLEIEVNSEIRIFEKGNLNGGNYLETK